MSLFFDRIVDFLGGHESHQLYRARREAARRVRKARRS